MAIFDLDAFIAKYVQTNVPPGSKMFDKQFLVNELLADLSPIRKECQRGSLSLHYYLNLSQIRRRSIGHLVLLILLTRF